MTDDRPLVLHVVEASDGGVPNAVNAMIGRAPDARHVVLYVRRKTPLGAAPRHPGAEYRDDGLRVTPLAAMRLIRRTYRGLSPDVVHAHSSFGGLYVRLLPGVPRSRIVYSPHCFAFERRDVGPVVRKAFELVERMLTLRTRTVVALSAREADLARSLGRVDVAEARNVDDVPDGYLGVARPPAAGEPLAVAASGRLCPQKDPSFFADVVRAARGAGLDARWTWIGDGDARHELEELGVEVTGWLDRDGVLEAMSKSHVCLHTAAWETGVPISVLEAAALGVPVVARAIPAMEGTDVAHLVADAPAAVEQLLRLRSPDTWTAESGRTQSALAALLGETSLADALVHAYRLSPAPARAAAGAEGIPSVV